MKDVPQPYKKIIDESILDIADAIRKMYPFLEELLSDKLVFNVDDYVVVVKHKTKKSDER